MKPNAKASNVPVEVLVPSEFSHLAMGATPPPPPPPARANTSGAPASTAVASPKPVSPPPAPPLPVASEVALSRAQVEAAAQAASELEAQVSLSSPREGPERRESNGSSASRAPHRKRRAPRRRRASAEYLAKVELSAAEEHLEVASQMRHMVALGAATTAPQAGDDSANGGTADGGNAGGGDSAVADAEPAAAAEAGTLEASAVTPASGGVVTASPPRLGLHKNHPSNAQLLSASDTDTDVSKELVALRRCEYCASSGLVWF